MLLAGFWTAGLNVGAADELDGGGGDGPPVGGGGGGAEELDGKGGATAGEELRGGAPTFAHPPPEEEEEETEAEAAPTFLKPLAFAAPGSLAAAALAPAGLWAVKPAEMPILRISRSSRLRSRSRRASSSPD